MSSVSSGESSAARSDHCRAPSPRALWRDPPTTARGRPAWDRRRAACEGPVLAARERPHRPRRGPCRHHGDRRVEVSVDRSSGTARGRAEPARPGATCGPSGRNGSRTKGVTLADSSESTQAGGISRLPCSVAFHVERTCQRLASVIVGPAARAKNPIQPANRLRSPDQSTWRSATASRSAMATKLAIPCPWSRPNADP